MREGGFQERLDVIHLDIIATIQRGARLRRLKEGQRAARAGAEVDVLVFARGGDQRDDIFPDLLLDGDFAHAGLHRDELIRIENGAKIIERVMALLPVEDRDFIARFWDSRGGC